MTDQNKKDELKGRLLNQPNEIQDLVESIRKLAR